MAYERTIKGNRYLYKSVRVGKKVKSIYLGQVDRWIDSSGRHMGDDKHDPIALQKEMDARRAKEKAPPISEAEKAKEPTQTSAPDAPRSAAGEAPATSGGASPSEEE